MDARKIKVAILESDADFREGLVGTLKGEPGIEVVLEADDGPGGIDQVEKIRPDVILLGNEKPFTEGLEKTAMVVSRFENLKVIVLSTEAQSTFDASACRVGACFHLCRDCSPQAIVAAIKGEAPAG
jgi:two-component system response regulator DegU